MGEIFRAEDADLARIVAIKVLAERYANDEAIRARFTREALAAARLSNAPSTVTIFDVGEHDDHPYIVMEYLAGGSLADRLVARRRAAARTLARLARAGRCGARRGPRERSRPPRRQAGEPAPRQRRPRQGRRLRRRQRGRPRLAHRGGHRRRHGRLPRPGAGTRREGDAGERPLRARGRRLRAAHRHEALRARVLDRRGAGARERPDPARLAPQSRAAVGGGRRPRPRAREGARAPIRLVRRPRPRAPRRARPRPRAATTVGALRRPVAQSREPPLARCARSRSARCCCRRRPRRSPAGRRRPEGGRDDRPEDGEGDGHARRDDGRPDRDDRGRADDDRDRDDARLPAGRARRS